jgi:hypothetical protein
MAMTKSRLDYENAEFENYVDAQVEFWTNNGDRTAALPWTSDQLAPEEFRLWVASRKEAGREIDIETCGLGRWYALDFDPYSADPDLPEEWRSPVSALWCLRASDRSGKGRARHQQLANMITGGVDLMSRRKAEIVSLLRPAEALPKPHHPFPATPY